MPVDLTPTFKVSSAESELYVPEGTATIGQSSGGLSLFSNRFVRGYGNEVFGSDQNGIWLGAADFADAPFRVGMDGNIYLQSADGKLVIDTVNNRIVIYDADDVARVLLGYQLNGF
jgi:hypothetical protein